MRIIVVSDTHRDYHSLRHVVRRHPEADLFLHLGDGMDDMELAQNEFAAADFRGVAGNCDFQRDGVSEELLDCGRAKIFYTHGHHYNVKYGLNELIHAGRQKGANVILFGHTHIAMTDYFDQIYLMNPGSLGHPHMGRRTYGIVDVTDAGIVCHTVLLK